MIPVSSSLAQSSILHPLRSSPDIVRGRQDSLRRRGRIEHRHQSLASKTPDRISDRQADRERKHKGRLADSLDLKIVGTRLGASSSM